MSNFDIIFDTRVDTNKMYVSVTTNFIPRLPIPKSGKTPVYLHITGKSKRERLHLDVRIDYNQWNKKKQRLNSDSNGNKDLNLILDSIEAKITNIKVGYRLSEKLLTPAILKKELIDGMPRVNFCSYYGYQLQKEKSILAPGTYRRYESVLRKLKTYSPELIFFEIDDNWFLNYRKYLSGVLKNNSGTINSNIIAIKKYLHLAVKSGIKLRCDLDDIKGGPTTGNRVSLTANELKNLYEYFNATFTNESHKLILGYFLFSCMTGLRISDVQNLTRSDLENAEISFIISKTGKDQTIRLNKKAKEIINNCPDLFITKFTNEHINRELKLIMRICGITKKISFHNARHTFATSYLKMGGPVEKLRILLGHGDIKQTMIYVHIVAAEANKSINLLDGLF